MKISFVHRLALCVIVLSALVGAAQNGGSSPTAATNASATAEIPGVTADYQLGAGDVLSINVWKEPELSRVLPIRPDGKISLPLVGDVVASDKTAEQLQVAIANALRTYLQHPEVTVMVQDARSRRFNVVGQVQKPGSFVLAQPTSVLDALAVAGGFRDFAKKSKVYVLRVSNGSTERLAFNYDKVIKGESSAQNVLLRNNDTVVVP